MNGNTVAKRFFLSLFCISALCAATVFGGDHQISLSVDDSKERNSDRKTDSKPGNNGNTVTTVTATQTEACTLEVAAENGGDQKDTCQLIVAFLSKDVSGGKATLSVVEKKPVTIEANGIFKDTYSTEFVVIDKMVDAENSSKKTVTGSEYEGYIVLMLADGEVVAEAASSSRYLKEEWIEQCKSTPVSSGNKNKKKK